MLDKFNTTEYDATIVLNDGVKDYSFKELKELVYNQVLAFEKIAQKNVVVFGEDNFKFIINFLACVFAGKEIYLLNDRQKLKSLTVDYYAAEEIAEVKVKDTSFQEIDANNIIVNFFTSGSSAEPKLIKKTIWNLTEEAAELTSEFSRFDSNEFNFISTTQLNHLFGLTFHFMLPFYNGYTIHTKPICYPDEINTENAFLVATPAFLEKVMKHNVQWETPPKWIVTAGSKLNDDVFGYLEVSSNVIEIYGGTETGVIAYRRKSTEKAMKKFKNVIVSQDEERQIKVISNFFPEEEIVQNDIVEFQTPETFTILSRSDRMLKIQDKRASAPELEANINRNVLVETSYCLKVGEKLGCAVVLNETGKEYFIKKGSVSLIKHLKSELKAVSEIIPQKWRFIYEIPKNITGKVDKQRLEKIFRTNLSFPLIVNQQISQGEVVLDILFPKNSNFFQGHFDGYPILAGVVQLFFANWFIEDCFKLKLPLEQVKKIKFSNIIKPNEVIHLSLTNKEDSVLFKYFDSDKIYASGNFSKEKFITVGGKNESI